MRALLLSLTVTVGIVAGVLSSSTGCSSVDTAFDCHSVCDRYKTCYDANYDVTKCTDRCRTAAANDTSYRSKADQCEACIGDKSCLSATFACAGSCGAIVPGNQ